MLFKMQKHATNVDSKMLETKNGRLILSTKCAICGSTKIKIHEKKNKKQKDY